MAHVIEFPRRAAEDAAPSTLQQSIDNAIAACLDLGLTVEAIIDELERNLARLSEALPRDSSRASDERAQQISDLESHLTLARSMIKSVREELAHPASAD